MRLRFFATISLAVFLCMPAAAATRIDDPAAFVRSVYAALAAGKAAPEDIYTPRLGALFAQEEKEANGEVGRMDFSFWINAQDGALKNLTVTSKDVESAPDRRVVTAKFRNGGEKDEIHFYFEKTKSGWMLDDARSLTGESWTLSLVLKYGWDGDK